MDKIIYLGRNNRIEDISDPTQILFINFLGLQRLFFIEPSEIQSFSGILIEEPGSDQALALLNLFEQIFPTFKAIKIILSSFKDGLISEDDFKDTYFIDRDLFPSNVLPFAIFPLLKQKRHLQTIIDSHDRRLNSLEKSQQDHFFKLDQLKLSLHEALNPLNLIIEKQSIAHKSDDHLFLLRQIQSNLHWGQQIINGETSNFKISYPYQNVRINEGLSLKEILAPIFHSFNQKALEKQIQFPIDALPNIWGKKIKPQYTQVLQQIIFNLLHNAFKFNTGPEISASLEINPEETFLTIKIKNNYQFGVDHHQAKGQGLGLKFIYQLVQELGAEFTLEDEVGSFLAQLTLPFTQISMDSSGAPNVQLSPNLENFASQDFSHMLILEDSPEFSLWAQNTLPGIQICSNLQNLEESLAKKLNILLIDLSFDKKRLISIVQEFKLLNPEIIIFSFSGNDGHSRSKMDETKLFDGALPKPFTKKILFEKIKSIQIEKSLKNNIDIGFLEELSGLVEDKTDFFKNLFNLFQTQSEKLIPLLQYPHNPLEAQRLIHTLHQLKSTSALVGAKKLSELSSMIHDEVQTSDFNIRELEIKAELEGLLKEYNQTLRDLQVVKEHPHLSNHLGSQQFSQI